MSKNENLNDHFSLLGIEPSPDIDLVLLRTKYFEAQRKFHPDKAKDSTERLHFLQQSANLNTAYHVLENIDNRLFYLLSLRGISIVDDTATVAVPSGLLMEVMQWREQAEEAITAEEKHHVATVFSQTLHDLRIMCSTALIANDLKQAKLAALKLRYLGKILSDMGVPSI